MSTSRREFLKTSVALASASALPMRALAKSGQSDVLKIAKEAVQSKSCPAIQLAVIQSGQLIENIALGYSDLEARSLASATTIFRIGSLTKQITGALLLKLSSEGEVALDDPASKYLPFLDKHAKFSLRELLHHTAGVHDDQEASPIVGEVTQWKLAQAISEQDTFFDFQPGTAWLYSNANYILLGAVIEASTGLTLDQAIEKYITKSLHISHTSYDDPAQVVVGRADGYVLAESGNNAFLNAPCIDVTQAGAAGAMRSTATELAKLHQGLLFGDLLTPTERVEFLSPAKLKDGRLSSANRFSEHDRGMGDTQYGFGVYLNRSTRDKSLIVQHNGFIDGFSSYLATHVPTALTVACVCNIGVNPELPFRKISHSVFKNQLASPKV
jgi:D-alanyl-D-alanine carboxypeptidase